MADFNLNNRTRKRRTASTDGNVNIRVKPPTEPKQRKTNTNTLRKDLLRFIRSRQKAMEAKNGVAPVNSLPPTPATSHLSTEGLSNSDFKNSLDYLQQLSNEVETAPEQHHVTQPTNQHFSYDNNRTLKRYPTPSVYDENVSLVFPESRPSTETPKYGCMKNGQLPTYRNYMRQTVRNNPNPLPSSNLLYRENIIPNEITVHNQPISHQQSHPLTQPQSIVPIAASASTMPTQMQTNPSASLTEPMKPTSAPTSTSNIQNKSPFSSFFDSVKNPLSQSSPTSVVSQNPFFNRPPLNKNPILKEPYIRNKKYKKIARKKFQVGKTEKEKRVGVLISNKTIRKEITTKKHLLKQTPIMDMKKFLMKRGFLRVGTQCPKDVLQKMYETSKMICGEIENHNSDNLMYNFLMGDDTILV